MIAIVCGYLLDAGRLVFVIGWATVAIGGLVAWRRSRQMRWKGAVSARHRLQLWAFVVIAGLAFGGFHVWLDVDRLAPFCGQRVTVSADVMSVLSSHGSPTVYLSAQSVESEDGVRRPCKVTVAWHPHSLRNPVKPGDSVHVTGTLGQSTRSSRPHQYTLTGTRVVDDGPPESVWTRSRVRLQNAFRVQTHWPAAQVQLVDSLVFGDNHLPAAVRQQFLAAGLLHVLAASGANVLLLEFAAEKTLRPVWRCLRLPEPIWWLTLATMVWLYAQMCGNDPSIVRACTMSTYRIAADAFGRKHSVGKGLSVAAVCFTLQSPLWVSSAGAVLSFVATAGVERALQIQRLLARTGPSATQISSSFLRQKGSQLVHAVGRLVVTTLLVDALLTPLCAMWFGNVTPYSLLSNLLMEPLFAALLPLSAGLLLAAPLLSPHTAGLFAVPHTIYLWGVALADHGLQALTGWVTMVAAWPGALLSLPTPPWYIGVPYYLGWLILLYRRK